ncbi:MAG: hypothetical protein ABJK20_08015 [Halieaceae bacterium]
MAGTPTRFMRNLAAILITLSGISHLAGLWFLDLSNKTLLSALFGAVYLYIGLGLFGQSRFTLFMAMVIPAGGVSLLLQYTPIETMSALALLRIAASILVILFSAIALWNVRNDPRV